MIADTCEPVTRLGLQSQIEDIAWLVKYWVKDELVSNEGTGATTEISLPSIGGVFLAARPECFIFYICAELEKLCHCYMIRKKEDDNNCLLNEPSTSLAWDTISV